ncbi:MAG: preprotein translocase subunit YajC, partial [Acidimicrobiales bacterium]
MPLSFHLLAVLGVLGAAAKKSSSSSSFFIIVLVIIAGAYLLFIAPQRRKQRARVTQQRSFEVGDEVVTTGGIYGRVESSDGDRGALDIAEGVVIEVTRAAIARRVDPQGDTATASEPVETESDAEGAEVASHDWEPPQA